MLEGYGDGLDEKWHWYHIAHSKEYLGPHMALRNILWSFQWLHGDVQFIPSTSYSLPSNNITALHIQYKNLTTECFHFSLGGEPLWYCCYAFYFNCMLEINLTIHCYYFCFTQSVTFPKHIFKNQGEKSSFLQTHHFLCSSFLSVDPYFQLVSPSLQLKDYLMLLTVLFCWW